MACGYYCTNWRDDCSRAGKYVWVEGDDPDNPPHCEECGEEMVDEEVYNETR